MTNLVRGRDIVLNPLTHPTRRPAVAATTPPCVHYWQLDRRSHGRCIRCGSERQFPSWGLEALAFVPATPGTRGHDA